MINEQITSKFCEFDLRVPARFEGTAVVDLGSGTGVDVYIPSYFVK